MCYPLLTTSLSVSMLMNLSTPQCASASAIFRNCIELWAEYTTKAARSQVSVARTTAQRQYFYLCHSAANGGTSVAGGCRRIHSKFSNTYWISFDLVALRRRNSDAGLSFVRRSVLTKWYSEIKLCKHFCTPTRELTRFLILRIRKLCWEERDLLVHRNAPLPLTLSRMAITVGHIPEPPK